MKTAFMWILPLLLLPGGVDAFQRGTQAYQEGRFKEALQAFDKAERAAGNHASPALLFNKALAALHSGELLVAEYTAEKAAARGGLGYEALRDFLLGNIYFKRCEKVEKKAVDQALAHAEQASAFWQAAQMRRPDWPESRRNVERALLKIKELKTKKEMAQQPSKEKKKKIKVKIDPMQEGDPNRRQPLSQVTPQQNELSLDRVKGLFDKLEEKKKEKLMLRRRQQRMLRSEGEKDW
jgi:hypothetical protein